MRFRSLFLAVVLCFGILVPALVSAQTTDDRVVVPKSLLTSDQLRQVQVNQTAEQLQTVGKFAGVGKEIGEGVNGALSAITDNADKFSKTSVGKFAMYMVAFKILGGKAIRLVVGSLLLAILLPVFIWIFYRNCMVRSMLVTVQDKQKTYKVFEPDTTAQCSYGFTFLFFLLGLILFTAL